MLSLFFCSQHTTAQNNSLDSLIKLANSSKADTNKVILLNKICREYRSAGELISAVEYGNASLTLATQLNYKTGMADANNNIGLVKVDQGNFSEALKYYFTELNIAEKNGYKKGIGNACNNIGIVYEIQGKYADALKMQNASLKVKKEINFKYGVASSYNNIGVIYKKLGETDLAISNYNEALKILTELDDKQGIAYVTENISLMNAIKGYNARKANRFAQADSFFKLATEQQNKALNLKLEMDDKVGIITAYLNFGSLYTQLQKNNKALDYFNQAIKLSKEIGAKDILADSYLFLSVLDSSRSDYKSAYLNYKIHKLYKDSVDNEETKRKSLQAALQYDFDKKEIALKAQKDKQETISRKEKEKQRLIIYVIGSVLIMILLLTILLYYRYIITKRQKMIVELQKKQVDETLIQVDLENTKLKLFNQEAQYKLLKDQINPHFLFNALETISSLIEPKPELAKDFVIYLSDFLRINIQNNQTVVKLGVEINLLKSFSELQTIRFGEALKIDINLTPQEMEEITLPYFSILTLIENALKHNTLTYEKPLRIKIECMDGNIIVKNNLQAKKLIGTTTASGLNNLNERYKVLMGKEIIVLNLNNEFIVKLPYLKN